MWQLCQGFVILWLSNLRHLPRHRTTLSPPASDSEGDQVPPTSSRDVKQPHSPSWHSRRGMLVPGHVYKRLPVADEALAFVKFAIGLRRKAELLCPHLELLPSEGEVGGTGTSLAGVIYLARSGHCFGSFTTRRPLVMRRSGCEEAQFHRCSQCVDGPRFTDLGVTSSGDQHSKPPG